MVDRRNHHVFQPLLYQVATAALSPADIAYPIRAVLARQRNTRVWMAEVVRVDLPGRRVVLADGELAYDYLILAPGARHAYFGHDEWETLAPGLKTLDDAFEIRRRIMSAFERAEREPDEKRRHELMTFVVVGGGPTGVELAGAIGEIACQVMGRDFRTIDPCEARVLLVEAGPRVLPAFPETLSTKGEKSLTKLGVEVWTNAPVTSIEPNRVVAGAREIRSASVFWAAGVKASPLARTLGVELDRAGRVVVRPDLTVPGHPEVFVVGDLAALTDSRGNQLPGLAPVAIQQGRHAAGNVAARASRRTVRTVPLQGPRYARNDRESRGGGGSRKVQALGVPGLARLDIRPHLLADRLPQPFHCAFRVGLGLRHVPAGSPPDYWPHSGRLAPHGIAAGEHFTQERRGLVVDSGRLALSRAGHVEDSDAVRGKERPRVGDALAGFEIHDQERFAGAPRKRDR